MGAGGQKGSLVVISLIIVLLIALAAAFAGYKLLRGSLEHPANLEEMLDRLEPVNAASLRHLASKHDDAYLRAHVRGGEYRRLRRMRYQALRAYYSAAFHNSAVLLSYGELLAGNSDPVLMQFGRELCAATIRLRLALLRGFAEVFFCSMAPIGLPDLQRICDLYNEIGSRISAFSQERTPAMAPVVAEHFLV